MLKQPVLLLGTILIGVTLGACSDNSQDEAVSTQKITPESHQNNAAIPANTNSTPNPFATEDKKALGELAVNENQLDDSEVNEQDDYQGEQEDEYKQADSISFAASDTDEPSWNAPEDVAYAKAEIMISTPNGGLIKQSFGPGEAMVLNQALPDGLYLWESVVTPEIDPYSREEMAQVRASGDFKAERELIERLRAQGSMPTEKQVQQNRQSGGFTVTEGVARPTSIEASGQDQD